MVSLDMAAVRAAVAQGKELSESAMTAEAWFFREGNTTPLFKSPCRVKKPKPSSFDAGNQTNWSTKRDLVIQVPLSVSPDIIQAGLIIQVHVPDGGVMDGDPAIYNINFTVQSQLDSQFAAARNINVVSEILKTPRIVP